jgi:hypothetical protein
MSERNRQSYTLWNVLLEHDDLGVPSMEIPTWTLYW